MLTSFMKSIFWDKNLRKPFIEFIEYSIFWINICSLIIGLVTTNMIKDLHSIIPFTIINEFFIDEF